MKKSSIIILITSFCLIFGGILIAVISGSVGGARQFKEESAKHTLDFDLPIEGVELQVRTDGITITSDDDTDTVIVEDDGSYAGGGTVTEGVADYDMSKIRSIELDLGAGEIELKKSSNDQLHYEMSGAAKVYTKVSGDTLKIDTKLKKVSVEIFGIDGGNIAASAGEIVLYLPEKVYEEISIELGAGTCTGMIPECKEFSVDLGAGEIDLKDVKTEDMDIHVGMGEISLTVLGKEADYDYDVEVGAGEVNIGSRSYSGIGSGGKQNNGSEKEIEVECGMGEVTVSFEND